MFKKKDEIKSKEKESPKKEAPVKKEVKQMEVPALANKARVLDALDVCIEKYTNLRDILEGVKIFINNKVD